MTPGELESPVQPPEEDRLRRDGQRIDALLEELREMTAAPAYERIEELVQRVVRLYGSGLERLRDAALDSLQDGEATDGADPGAQRQAWLERVCGDDLLAGLLLIHGLHPQPPANRVRDALAKLGRQSGRRAELVDIDDARQVARVRLLDGRDSDEDGLVERTVMDAAPELAAVHIANPQVQSDLVPLQLRPARSVR